MVDEININLMWDGSGKAVAKKTIKDPRYRALIERLVEARHESDLTQAGLAKRIGWHQQFVGRYELCERRLDIIEYLDIAYALGLDGLTEAAKYWAPPEQP